jgi:hypothetical protein
MKNLSMSTRNVSLLSLPILIAFNTLSVGTAKAIALVNPSFEDNSVASLGALPFTSTPATTDGRILPDPFVLAASNFVIVTENNINGNWRTNATDRGIEIWNNGFAGGASPVSAAAGNGTQFAELNAIEATALFQDLPLGASVGSTQLFFSFLHRARAFTVGETALNAVRLTIVDDPSGTNTTLLDRVFATQLVDNSPLTDNGWARYTSDDFAPFFASSSGSAGRVVRYQFEAVTLTNGNADIFSTTGATPTRTLGATGLTTTNNGDLTFGNFLDAANLSDDPAAVGVPFDFEANVGIGILGALFFGRKAFKSWKNKKEKSN